MKYYLINEMNEKIFKYNLERTIEEIKVQNGIESQNYLFIINPIKESGKPLNSKDDVMRLNILSEKNIKGKSFNINEVVALLTFYSPLVPIWIEVRLKNIEENEAVFQLNCSLRLRKPSLLRNQETEHPPFKVI